MKEEWKDIEDFEGYYQVSNLGRIKSLKRIVPNRYGGRIVKQKIRVKGVSNCGYEQVFLRKDQDYKMVSVHRLVATAFIDNPDNKPHINHKDSDKQNNVYYNLEWVTPKENQQHAVKSGNYKWSEERKREVSRKVRGEKSKFNKLSRENVISIKKMLSENKLTQTDISKMFGVTKSCISSINTGRTWKHIDEIE